jgi:hypothetical protein
MFEYLRAQNSGCPLQGVVLDGSGAEEAAVLDMVPLLEALVTDSGEDDLVPTSAVNF